MVVFETPIARLTRVPAPLSVGSTQQRYPRRLLPPRPLPQLSPTSLAPPFRVALQERRPQAEPRVEPPSSSPHGRAVKKPRVSPRLPGSGLGPACLAQRPGRLSSPRLLPSVGTSVGRLSGQRSSLRRTRKPRPRATPRLRSRCLWVSLLLEASPTTNYLASGRDACRLDCHRRHEAHQRREPDHVPSELARLIN